MDQTKENCELIRSVGLAIGWTALGSPPLLWAKKRERSYEPIDNDDDLIVFAASAKAAMARLRGWIFRSCHGYYLDEPWKYTIQGWIPVTHTETNHHVYNPMDQENEAHALLLAIAEALCL